MKTSHKLLIASGAALPFVGLAGVVVHAADNSSSMQDTFASKIASRFNLNKDEVKTFLDEEHATKEAEIQAKVSDTLTSAGFTETQIAELQAKKTEQRDTMKTWRDANPNASQDEIKAQHDKEKTEFETWATEKGIDLTKVRDALKDAMPMGRGRGHGGPRMMNDGGTPPVDAPAN